MPVRVSAIVAMSENSCIGKDNDLPWHIPEDLKHFKTLTMGKPVIMGRKTYESIVARLGKPLPGRANIVISRTPQQDGSDPATGPFYVQDIEAAIAAAEKTARQKNFDEIFIGGGGQIFELALPQTDRIYLTKIHAVVNGDAFFPELSPQDWQETERAYHEGDPSFSFITLDRAR